jgi:uncharacterized coiled-coil protein SlyX
MPYGTIKVDNITFTDNSVDKTVSLSGLIQNPTFTGNVTVTGTISGDVIRGGTTISGVTVTGTTANFVSGVFTTQVSGTTITGTTVATTTGSFVSLTGTTATFTSGIIASGTAALPSLAILSDPNTGIYSPGADQLAISTNGTGRLYIGSDGKIGVGTSPSTELLTVSGRVQSQWNVFVNGGTTSYEGDATSLVTGASAGMWAARSDSALLFAIGSSEKARLDSSGRLGIGTSSPGQKLDVNGEIVCSPNTAGKNTFQFTTQAADDASLVMRANTTIKVNIQANGASYFNGGNVGIGTSSPPSLLSVASSSTTAYSATAFNNSRLYLLGGSATGAYNSIGFTNASQAEGLIGFVQNASGYGDFVVQSNHAGYAERLRVTSAGLVGIGTSAPTSTLHIQHAAQTAGYWEGKGLLIHEDATANQGIALYSRHATEQYIASLVDDANSYLIIGTRKSSSVNGVDAVTIRGDGKVGIGTTSPSQLLQVSQTGGAQIRVDSGASNVVSAIGASAAAGYVGTTSNDSFQFLTNNSERARIDTSGRLLVGTSTSLHHNAQLQTAGTGYYGYNHFQFSNDAFAPTISVKKSRSASVGGNTIVQDDDRLGTFSFFGADGSTYIQGAGIDAFVDGTPGANDLPTRLVFSTTADGASSPTERMRITSGGLVGIGNTPIASRFEVYASAEIARFYNTSGQGTIRFVDGSNVTKGSIVWDGSTTTYNTSSDYRLKENVTAVSDGITRLQQLKPARFNFIADPDKTVDGFLAHEVQTIVPEAITGEKDAVDDEGNPEYQGIDQSRLVPLLTAALQEAIGRIETLEGMVAVNNITIDEQQHQLSTLAARLTALESA